MTQGTWTPAPEQQPDGTRRVRLPRESAMELLFEDHTDSPYAILMRPEQCGTLPARRDVGRTDIRCLVYSDGPRLELDIPARFRLASRLPHLQPWTTR